MTRYQFDLPAALRLRELIDEYGRMRRLEDTTLQRRGQQFNEFIAELLGYWGVDRVQSNVRSVGEIDVAFAIDGIRFLLEAKWEKEPVSFDPIAKLSRRITQRFVGTRGVFLSMSGYTADAQSDMIRGQQPDMLLLDRTHFEAMLSGLLSPHDLFTELVDRASYRGEVHMAVKDLVVPPDKVELPALALGAEPDQRVPVVTETAPGVQAKVVLHGTQALDTTVDGIAVDPDGRLLLTMPGGIARVDLGTSRLDWAVPIPGCRSGALVLADRSILVLHGATVLRWYEDKVQIVAGGFTGGTSLLPGPDGEAWVFDYKGAGWLKAGLLVTLTRLGTELGQEERHTIDFRAGIWSAVWLSGRRFYLAGDGHFGVVDLDKTTTVAIDDRLRSPHPDQRGSMRLDHRTVLTASRHGTVYRIDVENGQKTCMAKLDMLALGCDLAADRHDNAYILEHRGGPRAFIPVVVKLSGCASDRT
jgi:Holliday junction resolvase-like predicted endonuclease